MSDLETRLRRALQDEASTLTAHPTMSEDLVTHGHRVRRRRRLAGGVAGVAVLAVLVPVWRAVDNDGGSLHPVGPGPTVTTPSPSTATRETPPASRRLPAWGQLPVDVTRAPKRPAQVVDLRVGSHPTFDRIVIDFRGDISGYRVEQVSRLVQDGSGKVVRLPGSDQVLVRLTPAVAHTANGHPSYAGPRHAEYAMPVLRGVTFLGDFEGAVSLGLGLADSSSVRVFTLANPGRLVIDVHH